MPVRVGVDLVSVKSIADSLRDHGDDYVQRVFTAQEAKDCVTPAGLSASSLAARFAAKEAAFKALRVPRDVGMSWQAIEVVRDPQGWLELSLTGAAAELAASQRVISLAVSVTHEGSFACAVVVAEISAVL
jgi:holo-[acyl-carrier protein] synthase